MILPADPDLDKRKADDPHALIGSLVAERYRILSVAGFGGMGVVYKAEQIHMSRVVALKMLLRGADEQAFRRFRQEARAASLLDHPNIVGIYDFDVINDAQAYLAMDFLDGASLSQLVRHLGPLPVARVMHMFAQACDALEHAHNHGVVHRDIKPSNLVLIEKNGAGDFLKIVDFGLVKLMSGGEDQKLTTTNMVVGSPLYMSPEQCRGLEVDHRTDIYSLGCVMYEALVGKPPLAGDTPLDTLYKHIATPPLSMSNANPNVFVPLALEQVIQKSLSKDPAQRQQSMSELREELQAAASGRQAVSAVLPKDQVPAPVPVSNVVSRGSLPPLLTSSIAGAKAVSAIKRKRRGTLVHWALPAVFISLVSAVVIGSLVFIIFQQQTQEHEVLQEAEQLKAAQVTPPPVASASAVKPAAGAQPEADPAQAVQEAVAASKAAVAASKAAIAREAKEKQGQANQSRLQEKEQLAQEEAQSAFESGDWAAARTQFEKCLQWQKQEFGSHPAVQVPLVAKLAVCCVRLNDTQAADDYLNRFAALYMQHPQPLSHDQALLRTMSQISDAAGMTDLAERLLSAAISAYDLLPNAVVAESLQMRLQLADLLGKENRPVEQEKELRQVLASSTRAPKLHMKAELGLLRILRQQGRDDDASALIREQTLPGARRDTGASPQFGRRYFRRQQ
jgi:serine/threonine protein kinase